MRNKGGFSLRFPNNRVLKYATHEAYSNVMEVLSKGKYRHVGEVFDAAKKCYSGYEFTMSENKAKEIEKKFNTIDFDDLD